MPYGMIVYGCDNFGYTSAPTISGATLQALGGGSGTVVLTAVLASGTNAVGSVTVTGTFSGKNTASYTIPQSAISAPQISGGVKPTLIITFTTASTATVTVVDNSSRVEFDSTSFGGVPIQKHYNPSTSTDVDGAYLTLNTANIISSPAIFDYRDQIGYQGVGRNIKVVPINSGDTYYRVIQPNTTDSYATSLSAVNYARIAYFTNSDFTPDINTHGFIRRDTIVLVLLT